VLGAYACGAASIGASSIVVSVSLFERTGSPAWAGVGALIRVVPFMLFSGVAGVVIDRTDGRRMLVVAVTAQLACSLAIAATASRAPLVAVAALGFVSTLLWTPAYPSMASLVPRMVGTENLAPANALMSTVESVGWSVGPALGGLLLTVTGPEVAAAAAAGIAAVGAALALGARQQPLAALAVARTREPFLQSFRAGVRAIFATSAVTVPLVLVLVTDVVFGATQVVLLVAATEVLGMSRGGFGALSAALGAGSLAALLVINRAARSNRALVVLGVAVLGASLPLALVAIANGPPVALVLVGILGLGTVITDVLALTTLQRLIPSDRLARVFGILDSLLVGANVLGAAVSAWLLSLVGIRATLVVIGVAPAFAVVGVAALARRRVDPGAADLTLLRPAVDLLAGLPMLRAASITSIEALATAATERSMAPGTEAVRQGDAPDDFYAIVRGRFDVLITTGDGATRRVRSLGEGDGFGEIGLLHGVPRTATVVATTDARVLQVPGSAFLRAVGGGAVTGGTGPAAGAIDYFTAG
jgi:predicted MFS family arabinose efflux permease